MKLKTGFLNRGDFIKMNSLAIGALFAKKTFLFKDTGTLDLTLKGHIINVLGYPETGINVKFVTDYKLSNEYYLGPQLPVRNIGNQVTTNSDGYFEIKYSGNEIFLGLSFGGKSIVSKQIVNTNIPFTIIEFWHPQRRNQYNRIKNSNGDLLLVVDRSRAILNNHIIQNHKNLYDSLINNTTSYAYYPEHSDPDQGWGHNLERLGKNHWGGPLMVNINRDINLPWGSDANSVVPFAVGEGIVFNAEATHSGDYERDWDVQLESNYSYLSSTNNDNTPWLRNRHPAIQAEMCLWYLGKKIGNHFDNPMTNIQRMNELKKDFIGKRIWMMGTWVHDTSHEEQNEIHPAYWVVPYIGGVRRFLQEETCRLNPGITDAQKRISLELEVPPENLLVLQQLNIDNFFSGGLKTILADKYAISSVHLNQFGVNQASLQQGVNNPANSLDYQSHYNWALNQPAEILKSETKRRTRNIFNAILNYGSGFQVFSAMVYTYESIEILKLSRKYPDPLLPVAPVINQQIIGEEALNTNPVDLPGKLAENFFSLIDRLTRLSGNGHKEAIASLCADFLIRMTRFGIIPAENITREDQVQRFMSLGNDLLKLFLTNFISKIWNDLIPYTRVFSSEAY